MELLIAKRRKDWKKRTIEKIKDSNTFVSAMYQFMDEYLYYVRDEKELKRRLKKLLWEIDKQLSNLVLTREKEFDKKKILNMKKDFNKIMEKKYDFGNCARCGKKAVTAIEAGKIPLCAYHYVQQEDEECLKALLSNEIDEYGKITEPKEIQIEIKKQKPRLYSSLKEYFNI